MANQVKTFVNAHTLFRYLFLLFLLHTMLLSSLVKNVSTGNRTTPSYVAFTDTERLIGDAAKNQVAMNPHNTVFGKCFSHPAQSSQAVI